MAGSGDLIVTSIKARDFQVVQSAILVIAASFVVVNLIVDLCMQSSIQESNYPDGRETNAG